MNYIQTKFQKQRVVLPVIHVQDLDQVKRNVSRAVDAAADGVFLINGTHQSLSKILTEVALEFPYFWLGVNFLTLPPIQSAEILKDTGVQGLWSDNARLDIFHEAIKARAKFNLAGVAHFGGFAFKYQEQPDNWAAAASQAEPMIDVITTSGDGTGIAPKPVKIKTIRDICPKAAIAIASGITPENVKNYREANAFLVATGIECSYGELDPMKTRRLVLRVQEMNDEN